MGDRLYSLKSVACTRLLADVVPVDAEAAPEDLVERKN